MSSERAFKERVSEGLHALQDKVHLEDVRRIALNGKHYAKTHPMTAMAVSLSAGIVIGYLAKAVVDHRRHNGTGAAP
ncbi:MAG TPA: hypothetical protein DCS11_08615 [Syntrophus sp. (in: bacteria)]|jgi:ElaB/YqjD/DUF883 family membrane-anchored ribosome-binding protein|nr:hypothetical protein [Syntrophus sp. (in: bacteria)]